MTKTAAPMTSGSIWKQMTFFAMPIFLGNLFQQLYNTVDSLIVGNFLGSSALAAVSSSGSLIFMLIGFLSGISAGAGVIVARFFGAGDEKNLQRAVFLRSRVSSPKMKFWQPASSGWIRPKV